MDGCQLTAFITATANALARNATVDQIEMMAAIFNQLGETLVTIATVRTSCPCEPGCSQLAEKTNC